MIAGRRLLPVRRGIPALALALLALALVPGAAEPASRSGGVTLSLFAEGTSQPGYTALIANFERLHPNVTINATYTCGQTELTELAAGDGPDLVCDFPGRGMSPAVDDLASAGDLVPLVKEPWTRRSLPLVTSLTKRGAVLYALEPDVDPYGVFVDETLFAKLGLKVPQTFNQLLDLCHKAQADGTAAFVLAGADPLDVSWLVSALAVSTVYARDTHWTAELKAGAVSFDGTPGWHQALEEFIEMNAAGCFEPGMGGVSGGGLTPFVLGQGLLFGAISAFKGSLLAAGPHFSLAFDPFPGGTRPSETTTFLNLSPSLSVNAHSSPANQAAAKSFLDFVARPAQDALYAETKGSLTQYEFLKDEVPAFMPAFAPVLARHAYVINPAQTWWNASVNTTFEQDAIGLLTGQETVDGVLQAMDAAWKGGPS